MALLEASFLWPVWIIRDWSLITGRGGGGGYKTGGGGQVKFYPYKRGGGLKKF